MKREHSWLLIAAGFLLVSILLARMVHCQELWAGVLAPHRAISWEHYSGLMHGTSRGGGAIPDWPQCTTNGAIDPIGTGSAYASPQRITDALTANNGKSCYVLLKEGAFYLNAAIRPRGLHNVELRGVSPTATILHFSTGTSGCAGGRGSCLIAFESSEGNYATATTPSINWVGHYTQGSLTIQVASGAGIVAGATAVVMDQCDDGYTGSTCSGSAVDNGGYFNCQAQYNMTTKTGCSFHASNNAGRPNRGQQEMADVISCSPACGQSTTTTLTLSHPLFHPNWRSSQSPQVWLLKPDGNIGIQNLTIEAGNLLYSQTFAIAFQNQKNVWISKVAIRGAPNISIFMAMVENAEVLSNYLYNMGQSNDAYDSSGFSLMVFQSRWENNIAVKGKAAWVPFGPYTGNVIAYNYTTNATTMNDFMMSQMWQGHSNGADYDLYEGNVVGGYINTDLTHGTQLMNTEFRNYLGGFEGCLNGECGTSNIKRSHVFALIQLAYNRYLNAILNVLGTPGVNDLGYIYANDNYLIFNGEGRGYPMNIGSGNQSTQWKIPLDPIVQRSSMFWGQWDSYHKATRWETGEVPHAFHQYPNPVPTACGPSTKCPASFYLRGKPHWWHPSIPFPPIGGDVTGGWVGLCTGPMERGYFVNSPAFSTGQCNGHGPNLNALAGHVFANSAMFCFLTSGGRPDGSGGPIEFRPEAENCYGHSSPQPPTGPSLTWRWRAPTPVEGAAVASYNLYQLESACPASIDLNTFTVVATGVKEVTYVQRPAPAATSTCSMVTAVSTAGEEGSPSQPFHLDLAPPEPIAPVKPGPPLDLVVTYSPN